MSVTVVPLLNTIARGETREQILAHFRDSLRDLVDPTTGQPIGEDAIRQSTMVGSRYYVEAESIDLITIAHQQRGEFLSEQVDSRRASTSYLEGFHGPMAQLPRLAADGGSGVVETRARAGAVFVGSSIIPNLLAHRARDADGLIYQVLFSTTTPPSGIVRLALKAIHGGRETNLAAGTKLEWINPPPDAIDATVVDDFSGASSRETDSEWGERLFDARGSRAKAGNAAHFRLWVRQSSSAVDRAYVYPDALGSGTVLVAVVQKRSGVPGALARIPSVGLMTTAVGYLTPPGSPVVPGQARVVVVAVRPQASHGYARLGLSYGGPAGWADRDPWPRIAAVPAEVQVAPAPTTTTFTMSSDTPLPSVGTPQLMYWNPAKTEFVRLAVATITDNADGTFAVALAETLAAPLAAGTRLSPYAARHSSIAKGIVTYFDSLGAGEVVEQDDVRLSVVYRRPSADLTEPYSVGERLVSYIAQALGGSVERGSVVFSPESPSIPLFDASQGPYLLVPGNIAVYPA